ncbi:MAG: aminoacyl-tRNA hydrolase [Candidatus Omnitrophota bacterium]
MKVIFGLGNPGSQYKNNRHNIGYRVIDKLAQAWNLKFKRSFATRSFIAVKKAERKNVLLAKPRVFMNNSGLCVKSILKKYELLFMNILVVCDDIDLPLGSLRLREKGSSAGHRGMASIISLLGTEEVSRLRVGVGRPRLEHRGRPCGDNQDRPDRGEVSDYVLSDFSSEEETILKTVIDEAVAKCIDWMNK